MIAAGQVVPFEDLRVGMKVEAAREGYGDVVVRGTIGEVSDPWVYSGEREGGKRDRFIIGRPADVFTLTEAWMALPEVEGPAVASWKAPKPGSFSFVPNEGRKVLGRWIKHADGSWWFKPFNNLMGWVAASRITSLTLVDPVPLGAIELLAEAQHLAHDQSQDHLRVGVLDQFFRMVNEVTP